MARDVVHDVLLDQPKRAGQRRALRQFAQRDGGGADLLVRARADRVLEDGDRLFGTVRASAVRSRNEVRVDRASARRAARGQKAFAGREARRAAVELRWLELSVPAPRDERGASSTCTR